MKKHYPTHAGTVTKRSEFGWRDKGTYTAHLRGTPKFWLETGDEKNKRWRNDGDSKPHCNPYAYGCNCLELDLATVRPITRDEFLEEPRGLVGRLTLVVNDRKEALDKAEESLGGAVAELLRMEGKFPKETP